MQSDQLDKFIEDILDKKQLPGIEDTEVRSAIVTDLKTRLLNQIDRAIVEALPEDKVDELNSLLERNAPDSEMQSMIGTSGVDVQQITMQTMLRFRELYLGEDKTEEV